MICVTSIKVRGYHLDLFKHVNNARYLEFLEEGRWDYFDTNKDFPDPLTDGLTWAVVNININYRSEATIGDTLEVKTFLSKVGNTSATMRQIISQAEDGRVVADADVTYVCFSRETKKAIPMSDEVRAMVVQPELA